MSLAAQELLLVLGSKKVIPYFCPELLLMSGFPWPRQWDSLRDFQREVGRLFESFDPSGSWRLQRPFPAMSLVDTGDAFLLCVLLPGVVAEDVDLSITGEVLTLRGERRRSGGVADESYRRQERQFGRWARTISLPDRVRSEEVTAEFTDGILQVKLPKLEAAKPRQINVANGPSPSPAGGA